ncbi:NnrS family protein [Pedosphaera parvula]|uniref:NnrS family protein n=1 Tax=Pedosphaera parvula (strain Ellin514) TaxID=320771 RepID=B9XAP9_PEDPL|nr:NnrS family protein [Pedosphaera parvula]EEF63084.1 NnrS family protein [Pedosphaera parvula Ellin514]
MNTNKLNIRLSPKFFSREPFRIFFPVGTQAGIIGVALWPLYFTGLTDFYPGLEHARIMAYGLFGTFIFGFLGTAMPRMLTSKPLSALEVFPMMLAHLLMVLSYALARIPLGDALFLSTLLWFIGSILLRMKHRQDLPPPGFVLVLMALICVGTGTILALVANYKEIDPSWTSLQRLLSSQGFVLLPILGIGPFLLPRFFGMQSAHDFPESRNPSGSWLKKSGMAFATGALIIITFLFEVKGWLHTSYAIRAAVVLGYMLLEMPFHRAPDRRNALGFAIRTSLFGIVAGFIAVAAFPSYRVALLHLTLIGGFAVITFTVATRVVFGHSGNLARLQGRNRWLFVAIGLMLFGMTTRISGDFWPKILASHYIYGALIWIAGVLLWAAFVLPKVLVVDVDK